MQFKVLYCMGGHLGFLSKAAALWHRRYPEADMTLEHRYACDALAMLRSGEVDAVVANHPEGDGDGTLRSVPLRQCGLSALVPVGDSLGARKAIRLEELQNRKIFTFTRHSSPRIYDAIADALRAHAVEPDFCYHVPDILSLSFPVTTFDAVGIIPSTCLVTDRQNVAVVPISDAPSFEVRLFMSAQESRSALTAFAELVSGVDTAC